MRLMFAVIITLAAGPAVSAQPFTCALQPDGKSVRVSIANPYKQEAQCMVNCQFDTTAPGTSFQISCGKSVAAGGADTELCVKTFDKGKLTRMTGGDGECTDPTPKEETDRDDDEVDIQTLTDPQKLRDSIRKNLPPEGQKMLDGMKTD